MQTQAVFENIAERIQQEISLAEQSIYIAVAWFTNKNLFNELIKKAEDNLPVFLMISNDDINLNSSIEYELLNIKNSSIYMIGDGDRELMHNKFCVIDYSTVITGSYNWSYRAENNFENVVITTDAPALAEEFINEFNNIRKLYYPADHKAEKILPLGKILKRLEIIKNYIQLEDIEELKREAQKLKKFSFNSDIAEILIDIQNDNFSDSVKKIQNFLYINQQLSVWVDPEVSALKLEIKILENQLNAYTNEKVELEKILSDFQHRHTIELGDIILEILRLQKLKVREDEELYKEAENEENQYYEQVETEKEKHLYELTIEEKAEIKNKFRKASFLCHPDKVSDEFADTAKQIFIDLKNAYESNNLTRVSEIFENLEKGYSFKSKSDTVTEKDLLKVEIIRIKQQIKNLEDEIISIKQNDTYKTIISIEDWDTYFRETKEQLQKEIEKLLIEII